MALDDLDSIDTIEGSDTHTFQEEFFKSSRPVVIKGLWDNYPARKKWTPTFFKDGFGHLDVGVVQSGCSWPESKRTRSMKFGDYLDLLSANDSNNLLIDSWDLIQKKRKLKEDFSKPSLIEYLRWAASLFFGCKSASSSLKQNTGTIQVFHTQLYGEKQVILIPPRYTDLLYKIPLENVSLADPESLNYFHFPGIRFVKGMKATLFPGDTLFVPKGYWHHIKYLDGGYAVSQRNIPVTIKDFASGLWREDILPFIDNSLHGLLGNSWEKYKVAKSRKKANREFYLLSYEKKFKNILPDNEKNAVTSRYLNESGSVHKK